MYWARQGKITYAFVCKKRSKCYGGGKQKRGKVTWDVRKIHKTNQATSPRPLYRAGFIVVGAAPLMVLVLPRTFKNRGSQALLWEVACKVFHPSCRAIGLRAMFKYELIYFFILYVKTDINPKKYWVYGWYLHWSWVRFNQPIREESWMHERVIAIINIFLVLIFSISSTFGQTSPEFFIGRLSNC